jgi:hypothetical protein
MDDSASSEVTKSRHSVFKNSTPEKAERWQVRSLICVAARDKPYRLRRATRLALCRCYDGRHFLSCTCVARRHRTRNDDGHALTRPRASASNYLIEIRDAVVSPPPPYPLRWFCRLTVSVRCPVIGAQIAKEDTAMTVRLTPTRGVRPGPPLDQNRTTVIAARETSRFS